MSAGWEAGDLALCISSKWTRGESGQPVEGDPVRTGGIYQVSAVGTWRTYPILWLDGYGSKLRDAYGAEAFRKVTPEEADEFDRETIALMNSVMEPVQ